RLDGQNYRELIAKAAELYDGGVRNILLDMSEVTYISSAGIVALHTIALMLRGEPLPNLESGWSTIRATSRATEAGMQKNLKLLNPRPEVTSVLEMVGFTAFLEAFQDQEAAIRAF
ncbi:MAG TPA: STAS domain-containing protein, partial [Anaerolineales bacterium]